ncbi:MAG: hypothetical protein A3D27_02530 [Omnitrophica WOR_2 bacterium RIFCSPHIGHO2_02_FULL_46_37]|nr:MAG: hypothetical protein A3D27_02530 [Omnitrophica WOR_2 bacterium RIFCSPHIGHO2_02_FULL_46_37]
MYIPEKKLITQVEKEFRSRIPFLSRWKIEYEKKVNGLKADMVITARYKEEIYYFCVEIKRVGYPQYVREAVYSLQELVKHNPAYYPVVVVPLISGQGIRICNERNTGYMDLTGNMKIAVGGIYVEKEGKPDYGREYSRPEQSIFSPKSSRISLCFLHGPQREFTRKDIMEKSGLSKGMVSRIVKLMTKTGYILEKANKLKLSNFNDLLSAWAESIINRRDIRRSYYVWAQSPRQLMRTVAESFSVAGIRYAFTQEAGASLVAPFSTFDIITAYIDSLNKFPAAELSATETSKGFNLVLIEPYDEVVLTSARSVLGMQVVDNLQLYADLKKNVLRGDKQAEHIRDIIGKELE